MLDLFERDVIILKSIQINYKEKLAIKKSLFLGSLLSLAYFIITVCKYVIKNKTKMKKIHKYN